MYEQVLREGGAATTVILLFIFGYVKSLLSLMLLRNMMFTAVIIFLFAIQVNWLFHIQHRSQNMNFSVDELLKHDYAKLFWGLMFM
jgi:hypothetical protein